MYKILILHLFFVTFCVCQESARITRAELQLLYDSLRSPVIDDNHAVRISGFSLSRGGQTIRLASGILRPFLSVHHRNFGGVFSGKGSLTVHPLTAVEQNEFRRQTGLPLNDEQQTFEFQRCVFWYSDTGFIPPEGEAATDPMKSADQKAVDRSLKYARNPYSNNILYRILREIVDPSPRQYLWIHFLLDEGGNDFFLEIDPRRFEEVVLSHPYLGTSTGFNFTRSILCSFHFPGEYDTSGEYELTSEDKRSLAIDTIRTSVRFGRSKDLVGDAALHLRGITSWPPAAVFSLVSGLKVQSITTDAGKQVPFLRDDDSYQVFVLLPSADSGRCNCNFQYGGEFFVPAPIFKMASFTRWYPDLPDLSRINFDMTFAFPSDLVLFAGGTLIGDTTIGGIRQLRYVSEKPCLINSFTVGEMHPVTSKLSDGEIPVTVLGFNGSDQQSVANSLGLVVRFYSQLIGPFPSRKLCVVPDRYGQAYPDFIRIPSEEGRGYRTESDRYFEQAHEMAHAYWGHSVGWKSYHDQWLSEGLATYYGMLYAGFARQNTDISDLLKYWREKLTNVRKFAFGSGPPVGSIWLGYRASAYKTGEDYLLLDYYKGAWVIHMLRMLMKDMKTWKDDRFNEAMKDFYETYKDKNPSAEDFRVICERHAGGDLRWFFDEWVYRWEIPVYRWTKSVTRNSQGTWSLRISVEESGIPETFVMPVMIEIRLRSGSTLHARLVIDKPSKEFTYELQEEPVSVDFNSGESVLCTIE